MDFIKFKNVDKTYKNGVHAIYGLDLTIKKGDFVFNWGFIRGYGDLQDN